MRKSKEGRGVPLGGKTDCERNNSPERERGWGVSLGCKNLMSDVQPKKPYPITMLARTIIIRGSSSPRVGGKGK